MRIPSKLFTLLSSLAFSCSTLAADSDPGSGKTHLMIGQIYQEEYVDFINQVGLEPAGGSVYGTFYNGSFEQGSGLGFLNYLENSYPGSKVVAAMSFKDNPAGGGYGDVNAGLQATANGQEDNSIDSYINVFKSYPRTTFLLRVGYEVNSLYIGMDASLYKTAYRRIVDRIRDAGVNNVEFVYHPVRNFSDVEAFYPGKNYVDWFALSVFNHDVCLPNVSFAEWCNGRSVEVDIERSFNWAKSQGFPLLIAESAAQAPSNGTADGFNDYLARLNSLVSQFDVRALVYINSDWRNFGHDPNFTDSRVQKFQGTQSFWVDNFGTSSRYLYHDTTSSSPNPSPTPVATPNDVTPPNVTPPPSTNDGQQGIRAVNDSTGVVYFADDGWTAQWSFVCINSDCQSGTKSQGYIERTVNNLTVGQSYNISLKVQDNATGQYESPISTIVFGEQNDSVEPSNTPAPPTPTPTPNPEPSNSPEPTQPISGDTFGLRYINNTTAILYHADNNWTGSWNFLCINDQCAPGQLNNGFYEREVTANPGNTYNIEFKVQDNATGQCITGKETINYSSDNSNINSSCL